LKRDGNAVGQLSVELKDVYISFKRVSCTLFSFSARVYTYMHTYMHIYMYIYIHTQNITVMEMCLDET